MSAPPPPPLRKPGGARPAPSAPAKGQPPHRLQIPDGNVRKYLCPVLPFVVDHAVPEHVGKPAGPRLTVIAGMNMDQAGEGGWLYPSPLPSLALKPRATPPSSPYPGGSSKPKLVISAVNSPLASPLPIQHSSMPVPRPALASMGSSRGGRPSLNLCIPGGGGGGSGFSSAHDYPAEHENGADSPNSELKTPLAGSEDRNPTLRARGADYDGESSYGYGRTSEANGDQMSAMTEDIRQALSRSRFDSSPHPSSSGLPRSRAGSNAGSSTSGPASRRSSNAGRNPDELSLRGLSISGSGRNSSRTSLDEAARPPPSASILGDDEQKLSPTIDPSQLVFIRRLGEGTGGSVDLVKDAKTGQIMAKKVSPFGSRIEVADDKVIARTSNPKMHKQLLLELEILNTCQCPYIVDHYGSFLAERDSQIGILMEYCEAGSLDTLLGKMKKTGMRCSEHVLGRIAASVGFLHVHRCQLNNAGSERTRLLASKTYHPSRHQTFQYPCDTRRCRQAMRLWRLGRARRFDSWNIYWYKLLYGCKYSNVAVIID